jgi:hypothetical protein
MIKNADVTERLHKLIGKELTCRNLHEALFCELKHEKIMRRYHKGKYTYLNFKVKSKEDLATPTFVDINITGNPNTFQMDIVEKDGQYYLNSEARISYTYLT